MNHRLKPYLLPGLAILGMVGAWAVPLFIYTDTQRAERYAATVDQEIEGARALEARARAVKQALVDTEASRARLASFSIAHDGAADLITFLERGSSTGAAVSVGGVTIDPREGAFDHLRVSVRALGSFEQVMRLVSYVETAPYAGSITAAALSRGEEGEWEAVLSYFVLIQRKS